MQNAGVAMLVAFVAAGAPVWGRAEDAQPSTSATCRKVAGFIEGPFVPNESVARSIFASIIKTRWPALLERYPVITVIDGGDHWAVSQKGREHPQKARPGEVIVSAGGGQLHLDIDKCSGAISNAAFNR